MTARSAWLVAGIRTPFAKLDGPLHGFDAIELSVPVARGMFDQLNHGASPDLVVWGSVVPNLGYSNVAREVLLDAGLGASVPAFSTGLQCSTSMVGVFEAASMLGGGDRELALVGGAESMSRVQIGLGQALSDWLRRLQQSRSVKERLRALADLSPRDVRLFIPGVKNRATGMSMGEHCEEMARSWKIGRKEQDELALRSHERGVAAQDQGFFADLVVPVAGVPDDQIPRRGTDIAKLGRLAPVFDRTAAGTLTAGNSSPLTDGAAAVWVATDAGLDRVPDGLARVRLVDWEIAAVDIRTEGLLMAPAYAIPRLLARHGLRYGDIDLWEIHEAFAAQVLCNLAALEDASFLRERVGRQEAFGPFPRDRVNPNGGSIAIGHPFGATGARILSQATKELGGMPSGSRAVVSICADGGQGTVALLEAP